MRSSIVRVICSSLLPSSSRRQTALTRGGHSLTVLFAPKEAERVRCSGRSFALFAFRRILPRRPVHLTLQTLQLRHFPHRQRTKFPWRHIQHQRPQLHALDFFHQKPHALKHSPDLPIPPFHQNHFIPGIRPILHQPDFRRRSLHSSPILQLDRNSRPQTRNRALVRLPADFHQIRLRRV